MERAVGVWKRARSSVASSSLSCSSRGDLQQQLESLGFRIGAQRQGQFLALRVVAAQLCHVLELHPDAEVAQGRDGAHSDVVFIPHRRGKAFGGPVHGVDVVVAVMEEIAHLVPGRRRGAGVVAAQGLVQRGEAFVGLAVGAVQVQESARQRRGIGRRQPQVGQRRGQVGQHRVGHRLAHVRHQPFAVPRGQFRHVEAEFLRQRQHHRGRNRAVVVLHLVQVGQRDAQLGGEILLRQTQFLPRFPELRPGVELLCGHPHSPSQHARDARLCSFVSGGG